MMMINYVFQKIITYAIKLVDTEKLVLIHNDMVIGKNFLENLSELVDEKTLLTYTTIEPPIFKGHKRPGSYYGFRFRIQ